MPSHSRQLLLQLNTQRAKGFLCDVIIVVQNALFRAHKNILAASSAYLKSLHPGDSREPLLPPRHDSPRGSTSLLVNHSSAYKEPPPAGEGVIHPAERFRGSPPCAEPLARAEGRNFLYRWMKHETPGSYLEECEAGKEPEQEEKAESPPQSRYPSIESNELENDNSTSEDTGSSEGPSPGATLGPYCSHLAYEPESLGDNLYVCIPCGKASEQAGPFLDKGGQSLGDIVRPYRCSSCDKAYKDPATLRQHEKTHWLTRPYPCTICGKKFTQRGTMTRHMRSHLGLKPFACDACGMRFTRQYRLTEHMRIHSGEKPYECQVCGGKFAQQRNLISHMKMHVAGPDEPAVPSPDGLSVAFGEWELFSLKMCSGGDLLPPPTSWGQTRQAKQRGEAKPLAEGPTRVVLLWG
uniref:Hypermethylated in cancer 1 protein n=1 Tax=Gopherus evgoodei TaxID=1825980 RepID=A0A8C4Y1Q4_9SAUR